MTPPSTAYVYCDYCGILIDWDFQIAINSSESAQPGPQYEALCVALHPKMEEARLAGDMTRYTECQRELFSLHAEACPASYSPRIGDPAYREAIANYLATMQTISAFDEETMQLSEEMGKAMRTLRWVGTKVRSDTFWKLFDTYRKHSETVLSKCEEMGEFENHPDEVSRELAARIGYSVLAQGWLPHLAEEDSERLLAVTNLGGEYANLKDPELIKRHCGNCGGDLPVVEGARRVLCEACGFRVDVTAAEISCQECGAPISPPDGAGTQSCPYCNAEIRIIR